MYETASPLETLRCPSGRRMVFMEQQSEFGVTFYKPEGITQIQGFGPPRLIEVLALPILGLCLAVALAATMVFATTGMQAFQDGFGGSAMMWMWMMMRTAK